MRVSDYHVQLQNFIAALYLRNELYDSDRNRLLEIARNTQIALRDVANITRANRNAIRSNGTRWLKREIKRILKENGYYDSNHKD